MQVSEIFYSLQGEGFLAGLPSVFVRLSGCPLRCTWCDTKYAWDKAAGTNYSIEKILLTVRKYRTKFVVVTGGEPMINPDLPQLLQELKACEKHITVETAGIVYIPDLPCDLMSISPKLNSAAEDSKPDTAVLRQLTDSYDYQLKFVVDSETDLPWIQQTVENIGGINREKTMLMPQAATRDEYLAKSPMVASLCKSSGFAFSPRLQVLLWNNKRST